VWYVGKSGCVEAADTATLMEADVACLSSELNSAEPSAEMSEQLSTFVSTIDKELIEPSSVENVDNMSPGSDTTKVHNEPSGTKSSDLPDGVSSTELPQGHNVPQPVDGSTVTDAALNESVLQECIIHTLHRFILLHQFLLHCTSFSTKFGRRSLSYLAPATVATHQENLEKVREFESGLLRMQQMLISVSAVFTQEYCCHLR